MLKDLSQDFKKDLTDKVVVMDTSTMLLTGVGLLDYLPRCTLVIPAIVVKELEDKRTHSTVGFLSREWLRLLEDLRKDFGVGLSQGIKIPSYNHITVKVEPNHSTQANLPSHLQDKSNDSTILAVAKNLDDEAKGEVVLLSNDVPMRLHATLDLNLPAKEYSSTMVVDSTPFDGRIIVTLTNDEYLIASKDFSDFRDNNDFIELVKEKLDTTASHCLVTVMLEEETHPLSEYIKMNDKLIPLERHQKLDSISTRTLEQDVVATYLRQAPDTLPIVSVGGGAGTGKTLLAIAAGIDELNKKHYQKIMVLRSLHEMGQGQEMGFLPGDVDEKMAPWCGAIYDAIDVIAASKKNSTKESVKALRDKVEISPITYLRGRSLSNSYIVLEEAQNFSRNEIFNILSRAGEGSKIVIIGDCDQVDNRFLQSGANADIWSVISSLKESDLFAHITLKQTERSKVAELSSKILSTTIVEKH